MESAVVLRVAFLSTGAEPDDYWSVSRLSICRGSVPSRKTGVRWPVCNILLQEWGAGTNFFAVLNNYFDWIQYCEVKIILVISDDRLNCYQLFSRNSVFCYQVKTPDEMFLVTGLYDALHLYSQATVANECA